MVNVNQRYKNRWRISASDNSLYTSRKKNFQMRKCLPGSIQVVGWLMFNGIFSTKRLYRAMRKLKVCYRYKFQTES